MTHKCCSGAYFGFHDIQQSSSAIHGPERGWRGGVFDAKIELKLGKFRAADKGQMEQYPRWLDRYKKRDGEEMPLGLIRCKREVLRAYGTSAAGREQDVCRRNCLKIRVFYHRGLRSSAEGRAQRAQSFKTDPILCELPRALR